jgi:hypothetical protein
VGLFLFNGWRKLALKGKIANFASLVRAGPGLRQAQSLCGIT